MAAAGPTVGKEAPGGQGKRAGLTAKTGLDRGSVFPLLSVILDKIRFLSFIC